MTRDLSFSRSCTAEEEVGGEEVKWERELVNSAFSFSWAARKEARWASDFLKSYAVERGGRVGAAN